MTCCSTEGTNKFFSKSANHYAKRFRKKGLDAAQNLLASGLRSLGIRSKSLLEIGCGVGGLHLTLLKEGASSSVGVEISEGMLAKAKEIAGEMGLAERARYHVGDFMSTNGSIPPAHIVILDKVVCCYAEPGELMQKSSGKAMELYAVSYPRDSFLAKFLFTSSAFIGTVLRWSFHPYYHQTSFLENTITGCGFEEVFSDTTVIWQVKIFKRRG